MKKYNIFISYALILLASNLSCETKQDIECGYNGETIQVLANQNALVRDLGYQFYLLFEEGIITGSLTLQDTIHLLLPCNLPDQYKLDSLNVIVSGEVKENPGYSSHNNYTDFYINKILKAST